MKKVKYYYNTHTLKFEKHDVPLRVRLIQTFLFVIASIATGVFIMFIFLRYTESPNEKILRKQNEDLRDNYTVLTDRTKQLEQKMQELEHRDNNVYRSIFEALPIHDSARIKDVEIKKEVSLINSFGETELVDTLSNQLNNLSLRLAFQSKSYGQIENLVKNKEKLLLAIPAILVKSLLLTG